jgi:hypothetical protein
MFPTRVCQGEQLVFMLGSPHSRALNATVSPQNSSVDGRIGQSSFRARMRWLTVFAPAALARPGIARISPYDPDDALRPDNITGLVYEYYNEIGS